MGAVAADLHAIGRRIGDRSLIVPLDDQSAVMVAEYADYLSEHFILPAVTAGLPRRLASKAGLRELSQQHGVPAPMSAALSSAREVAEFAASAPFPVIAKNAGVWDNRNATRASLCSSSSGPRLIYDADELASLTIFDGHDPSFVVQEYIPPESSEDWIVHLYADATAECQVLFTGRKVRSWPLGAGVTACGISAANPALAEAARQFCKAIGYCGVAGMDWRLDRRDGQYKLLDFNPRVGNNFRLSINEVGVDVVHALHLDLTGRPVPDGAQVFSRRLVVEHLDIPSRLAARVYPAREPAAEASPGMATGQPASRAVTSTEYAWCAADDPLPLLGMLTRVISLWKIVRGGIRLLRSSTAKVARSGEMAIGFRNNV
jgi:predicted ATP-grasp superfamily ATP-dependent carboligase